MLIIPIAPDNPSKHTYYAKEKSQGYNISSNTPIKISDDKEEDLEDFFPFTKY